MALQSWLCGRLVLRFPVQALFAKLRRIRRNVACRCGEMADALDLKSKDP